MNNITVEALNAVLSAAKRGEKFKVKGKQGKTYNSNSEAKERLRRAIGQKFLEQQSKGHLTPSIMQPALDWIQAETQKNAGMVHAPNLVLLDIFAGHIKDKATQHNSSCISTGSKAGSSGQLHGNMAHQILHITHNMKHEGGVIAKIRRGLNRIARALIRNPKFDPEKARDSIRGSLLTASRQRIKQHAKTLTPGRTFTATRTRSKL